MTELDPKGVEAALRAADFSVTTTSKAWMRRAITAYLANSSSVTELLAVREALSAIIQAHDENSGAEPSVSVFEREIDRGRAFSRSSLL